MMSKRNIFKLNGLRVLVGTLALALSTLALAAPFVPYPGKREATLVRVEAPNLIFVTFNTDATGFFRTLGIRLPGIVVAQDTPQADECEREAAKKAMGFTQAFLADAKKIYVQDMLMENAADEEAISPILTDKGSLSAALIKEGIARPDTVDPDVSWCK
jgi:endonuclease YncB( thermonuclease family)